jgi:uncharacterized protein YutE (UPF0331/DUF86 family)
MAERSKRTTVYFNPDLYKALQLKSIAVSKSVSDLVNEAVRELLKKDKRNYKAILDIMAESPLTVKNKTGTPPPRTRTR